MPPGGENKRIVMTKTNSKLIPLFCQCQDCLEHFSIDGLVDDEHHIVKLESHGRIAHNGNSTYQHRCGGNGHRMGRLTFYPMVGFGRS